jgi:hypothetical protein
VTTQTIRRKAKQPVPVNAPCGMLVAATRAQVGSHCRPLRFVMPTEASRTEKARRTIDEGAEKIFSSEAHGTHHAALCG